MIVITGDVELKPEHREAGIKLCREHSDRSRKEPGCISHDCTIDLENDNMVRFIERWEDMDAVQVHFQVPESREFVQQIGKITSSSPDISILNAEPLQDSPF